MKKRGTQIIHERKKKLKEERVSIFWRKVFVT